MLKLKCCRKELFCDVGASVDKSVSTVTCRENLGPDNMCTCFGKSEKKTSEFNTKKTAGHDLR